MHVGLEKVFPNVLRCTHSSYLPAVCFYLPFMVCAIDCAEIPAAELLILALINQWMALLA